MRLLYALLLTLSSTAAAYSIIQFMADYDNPLLTITRTSTPDPFVTSAHGKHYLSFTAGNRVELWSADSLTDFQDKAEKTVVWRPPPDTNCTAQLWAPELHNIYGRWYIYVAGAHPAQGNKSHRMYVLGGPPADTDPTVGRWENLGLIRGLPQQQWQIDGTVFSIDNQLYLVYSGWPFDDVNLSDLVQELFIVPLSDPVTAAALQPMRISTPEHPWEWTGDHGINEGPQWFESADGRWRGLVYSCAGSWTKDYKMATLQYTGGDPMNPSNWRKSKKPLIENAPGRGPYAPGHGMFMKLEEETVAVFHATDNDNDGWNGRKARVQRVKFTDEGPEMGGCVGLAGNADIFTGYVLHDHRHERRHSLRDTLHSVFPRFI